MRLERRPQQRCHEGSGLARIPHDDLVARASIGLQRGRPRKPGQAKVYWKYIERGRARRSFRCGSSAGRSRDVMRDSG